MHATQLFDLRFASLTNDVICFPFFRILICGSSLVSHPDQGHCKNAALYVACGTFPFLFPPSNDGNYWTSGVHQSIIAARGLDAVSAAKMADAAVENHEWSSSLPVYSSLGPLGTSGGVTKNGKKRGTTLTSESCSKVYSDAVIPLVFKQRWEHTSQARSLQSLYLARHQQVQLLKAAAILSHLSPWGHHYPRIAPFGPRSFLVG